MKILFTIKLFLLLGVISAQQMIVPRVVLTNGRTNFYSLHYFNTSIGENGVKLLLHADLLSIRSPNIKLSIEHYRHDHFSNNEDIDLVRLKANYVFRITRRLSFTLAGSSGLNMQDQKSLLYSGGFRMSSRKISASYHLFGQKSDLAHTFQFYLSPVLTFNKEAKYSKRQQISLKGAYTINSELPFVYCSNYVQANLELNDINIGLGIHESSGSILPNTSITFKNIGNFDLSATLFLNKISIPDVQVSITYKKRRFKPRYYQISNPNF